MRILQLSHDPLPDERIERAAYSARNRGHEVYFAGRGILGNLIIPSLFSDIFTLPFSASSNIHLSPSWNKVKRRLLQITSEIKPDIIHAHNIIAARLAYEIKTRFLYDDHEYWSKSTVLTSASDSPTIRRFARGIVRQYAQRLWANWENDIVQEVPVITVSDTIAEEHAKKGARTFVVPNMPSKMEIARAVLQKASDSLSSAYVGSEVTSASPHPVRDASGLKDLFASGKLGTLTVIGDRRLSTNPPVYSTGYLDHVAMMSELSKHNIGLIPWKPFWFHRYCNPNKAYEYVHAGLLVVATSDLTPVISTLKEFCIPVDSYEDLSRKLASLKDQVREVNARRSEILQFARENCMWENYDERIFQAYSIA